MPKSPTRPTQYPSPQWARALHRGKPRHSCRGGRPHLAEIRGAAGDDPGDRGRHCDVGDNLARRGQRLDVRAAQPQEQEPLAGRLDLGGVADMTRGDLFKILTAGRADIDELLRALELLV